METAIGEYERLLSEYEESKRKAEKLGGYADALIQMFANNPGKFSVEYIMQQLMNEHEEIGFEEIKKRGDGEK